MNDLITIQTIRTCQPTFSAAFIAHIEATLEDETIKNELCKVVPLPNHDIDWIKMMAVRVKNQFNWNNNEALFIWLQNSRLEGGFAGKLANIPKENREQQILLERIRKNMEPAVAKLHLFMKEIHLNKKTNAKT